MVKLNKIYTRTGDDGTTGLVDGSRVSKDHIRMEAIGTVDEANAAIGLARLHSEGHTDLVLFRIQNDLFDLGADLATPLTDDSHPNALRITSPQVTRLEEEIDTWNEALEPLTSFILPAGTPLAAALHFARTTVRRAERQAVQLSSEARLNPSLLQYLNRLSDHLFVLARMVNKKAGGDVLWVPGAGRKE